jgi:hypothetical protein
MSTVPKHFIIALVPCWMMVCPLSQIMRYLDSDALLTALVYTRDHNRFEGSELDVSATQIQWLYHASYIVGLKIFWHRKLPLLLKTMKCAHEVCLDCINLCSS